MDITRRKFVKNASFGMLLMTLHPETCFANNPDKKNSSSQFDLIKNIHLLTSTSLQEMKEFYVNKLGLNILTEKRDKEITFIAGKSTLTFTKTNQDLGNPWYHFAFNIPENKILKARAWQLERSELILTPKRLRDPNYPNDVRHFRNWNAHSVFFWDPAGNVLEYIARHNMKNRREGAFTSDDILNISEIGFVVDDQQEEAKGLHKNLNLDEYPKGSSFWWSMGDENGLLLCLPKRIWGETTDTPKKFDVFKTEATIIGNNKKEYYFSNFPYKVNMIK
ncbi:hypothetical protein [Aquimarina sp. 2201CG5-10]|uniref:VOC family protein n=1 Tax=Aquimarina callyspongiae TaxID=3098150 RepID=UPI002AB4C01A|nr:hypothetical protein [Aquimarina sp. 2201CG5-10]MDY8137080.1 hypothetical protein [Aquimarina sp. 2201CG5-10]